MANRSILWWLCLAVQVDGRLMGGLRVVGYRKGPGLFAWRARSVSQGEGALAHGRQLHPEFTGAEGSIDVEWRRRHHRFD